MALPTAESVAIRTAPESKPGGSYIPNQPPPLLERPIGMTEAAAVPPAERSQKQIAPPATFAQEVARGAKGRASAGSYDIDLTVEGLAFGDPVGLETFDLGFFEDGTPAIVINGANVPIKHEQWMALLTQRNKTRDEIKRQMEFENYKQIGRDAILKVARSGVSMPPGSVETLLAYNEMDPEAAVQNLGNMYKAVSTGRGTEMVGGIQADMQSFRNKNLFSPLLERGRPTKKMIPNPVNPQLPAVEVEEPGMSIRDSEIARLRQGQSAEESIAILAFERIEDFQLDPAYRKAFPGMQIGIFDRIHRFETGDRYSDMSLFGRLSHLAALHQMRGVPTIPMQEPNPASRRGLGSSMSGTVQMIGGIKQYRDYLARLDQFASAMFGYDASTAEALDRHAIDMMSIAQENLNSYMAGSSGGAQPQTPTAPTQSSAPVRSRRPSATGG